MKDTILLNTITVVHINTSTYHHRRLYDPNLLIGNHLILNPPPPYQEKLPGVFGLRDLGVTHRLLV